MMTDIGLYKLTHRRLGIWVLNRERFQKYLQLVSSSSSYQSPSLLGTNLEPFGVEKINDVSRDSKVDPIEERDKSTVLDRLEC
jgi:hypothetical protein